jgi:hypothetical protein
MRFIHCLRLSMLPLLAGCLAACMPASRKPDGPGDIYKEEIAAGVEEIYIFRTTRTDYVAGATPACSAAPFTSASQQGYALWSLEVRTADGRVVKTHEKPVGDFMACFSAIADRRTLRMFARGTTANVPWIGQGACEIVESQPPVRGLLALSCQGSLTGLPQEYSGGYISTSSLAATGGKDAAHVPGYLSTSVVTMRLWRKPKQ